MSKAQKKARPKLQLESILRHTLRSNISEYDTNKLHPHPLNRKVYGTLALDEKFLESIKAEGILQPILIIHLQDANFAYILSGHRRWLAAKQLGFETVPVCYLDDSCSGLLLERIVIESNRQRIKTDEQIGREYIELKRIEAVLAKKRMAEGGKKKGKANLPDPGTSRDKAANAVGIKPRTAEKLKELIEAVDSKDDAKQAKKARDLLDAVNRKEKRIDPAWRELHSKPPTEEAVNLAMQERQKTAQRLQGLFPKDSLARVECSATHIIVKFPMTNETGVARLAEALTCHKLDQEEIRLQVKEKVKQRLAEIIPKIEAAALEKANRTSPPKPNLALLASSKGSRA